MKENKLTYLLLMFMAVFVMASCSETDEESEEFPNWEKYNKESFEKTYSIAEQKIQAGDTSWKIIRNWSLSDDYPAKHTDNIVVNVLSSGNADRESPMYTDSVYIAYSGFLLPSKSFPNGYNFDKSYVGDFNPNTVRPMCSDMMNFVDGFTTAILHMHPGDYWRIYIPTELAYGNSIHAVIPQNSMLIFDLYLFDYFHPGKNPGKK